MCQAQDQFKLKPLESMTASRSLSSSFSRSRCSSRRATRESLCSTTSSISFRILFSSESSSSVFRWSTDTSETVSTHETSSMYIQKLRNVLYCSHLPLPSSPGAPAVIDSACLPVPAPEHWKGNTTGVQTKILRVSKYSVQLLHICSQFLPPSRYVVHFINLFWNNFTDTYHIELYILQMQMYFQYLRFFAFS